MPFPALMMVVIAPACNAQRLIRTLPLPDADPSRLLATPVRSFGCYRGWLLLPHALLATCRYLTPHVPSSRFLPTHPCRAPPYPTTTPSPQATPAPRRALPVADVALRQPCPCRGQLWLRLPTAPGSAPLPPLYWQRANCNAALYPRAAADALPQQPPFNAYTRVAGNTLLTALLVAVGDAPRPRNAALAPLPCPGPAPVPLPFAYACLALHARLCRLSSCLAPFACLWAGRGGRGDLGGTVTLPPYLVSPGQILCCRALTLALPCCCWLPACRRLILVVARYSAVG